MVFKSVYPDFVAPSEYKDCFSVYLWRQLDVHADKTILIDFESGRQWTGRQIKDEASRIAQYLINELHLKAGQGCVFIGVNNDYMQLAAIAVIFAGGYICVGEFEDPQTEHESTILNGNPVIAFVDSQLCEEVKSIRDFQDTNLNRYQICILDDHVNDLPKEEVLGLSTHLRKSSVTVSSKKANLPVQVHPDDSLFILFSSGSTGKRKPVPRTQRNALYTCMALKNAPQLWKLDDTCVFAGHLPLNHGTGLFCAKISLTFGAKLIIMHNYYQSQLLDAIEKYKITELVLGTSFLHSFIISNQVEGRSLSSLKNCVSVGSPLPSRAAFAGFMEKYPDVAVWQSYGLSEFGFVSLVPAEDARCDSTTGGMLLPNVSAKLVDINSGEEINELNRAGELFVRGPTLFKGYLGPDMVEQTKAAILPDGYYRTNDLALFDDRQHLNLLGRVDDVLCLWGSMKVNPVEIESLIQENPHVKEVAVIGVHQPDLPDSHELVARAFVVPKQAGKLNEQDICRWVSDRASKPKHLMGGVKLMDTLPRVALGKVNKKALREIQL